MTLVSIIVPMHNEEDVVDRFFATVKPILQGLDGAYEILCVDDGSRDGTLARLRGHHGRDPDHVKVIGLSRNFGKESALTAGLDHARGDVIIPIDADLQDPPDLIPEMLAKWREGFQVVHAIRTSRAHDRWSKRSSARAFYWLINRLTDVEMPPNSGDFRLLDRRVADVIRGMRERDRFMKGILSWPGFRQTSLSYTRPGRVAGDSKFSFWQLWNFALTGLTGYSTIPLRAWTYLGLAVAAASFLYALYLTVRTLLIGVDVPGYTSIMVAILFFSGVQLIGIGVLGEYIGRIHMETKKRPLYVIDEALGLDDAPAPSPDP